MPPTFPVVMEHWNATYASHLSDAGIDLKHVLHGEERIDYPNGPLRVGDDLAGTLRIVGDERTEGRSGPLRLVTLRMELHRPSLDDVFFALTGERTESTDDDVDDQLVLQEAR